VTSDGSESRGPESRSSWPIVRHDAARRRILRRRDTGPRDTRTSSNVEYAIAARPTARSWLVTVVLVMVITGTVGLLLTLWVLAEDRAFQEKYGRGIRLTIPETPWGHPGGLYIMAVAGAVFGAVWLFSWLFGRAVQRETAGGYTTLRSGRRSVPEVDPRSGRVVRAAGEPAIPAEERSARLRIIRRR
jgi:hypothetical protein